MGIGLLHHLRKHITCIIYSNKNNSFVSWNVWILLYMLTTSLAEIKQLFVLALYGYKEYIRTLL
jgi:hypothetical protein